MILAIEHNNATIALARKEDIVECTDASTADALRAEGYVPIGEGATSRPATPEEQAAYHQWAGRTC
jgi:hypothetical protein